MADAAQSTKRFMKKYDELVILLPCHSLEDFPLHHEGDEAEGLLAHWTAMWHPVLLQSAGKMPCWARIDDPPEELAGRLLLIPEVSLHELPAGFTQRAEDAGAVVLRSGRDRGELIARSLAALDQPATVQEELVADFLALGYCYLQVELLTRQMRYASNLDEVYFNGQVVAAAEAAVAGDEAAAREKLANCFNVLGEERDHFYPVDAYLMDLTLVAPTTIGESLREDLASGGAVNLLISGETLEAAAAEQPETVRAIRRGVQSGDVALIGGEYSEHASALWDLESQLAEFRRGAEAYDRILDARPATYGRRRFGLSPVLPQLLAKCGFESALHATFDGGQFPHGAQTKTNWEGLDGADLPALARPPLDATRPDTFLKLCLKMGESMDSDHVATVYFAHWPGQASPWYSDLRRAAGWGLALGKFVTVSRFFDETGDGGVHDRFSADDYRSPYLKQQVDAGEADPVTSVAGRWRQRAIEQAQESLATLAVLLGGDGPPAAASEELAASAKRFASVLPRAEGPAAPGVLVVNPLSFVRRTLVELPDLPSPPAVEKPVYAAGNSGGVSRAVIDVPPLGFAWVRAGSGRESSQRPVVEDGVLKNEFFEVRIDEATGGLRSLHDYQNRGNRLSQQLALRMAAGGRAGDGSYSVMAADSVEVSAADAAVGEITSKGRLVDTDGERLAAFTQKYRIVRGSRVLTIEIELEPEQELEPDPWNSYYSCRFAWPDEAADLFRTVAGVRTPTQAKRLETPLYLELEAPKQQTAFFTGGLPYHRRLGMRKLDSLLIVRGETARRFTLGVGVDVAYPHQEALALLTPTTAVAADSPPPAGADSGWLFHIDSRNVVATHWRPLIEDGAAVGFRVRLLEAYGRPAEVTLSTFRQVASAHRLDFRGEPQGECEAAGEAVRLSMTGREWTELEVRF